MLKKDSCATTSYARSEEEEEEEEGVEEEEEEEEVKVVKIEWEHKRRSDAQIALGPEQNSTLDRESHRNH